MTAKDLEQMLGLVGPWRVTSLEIDHAARTVRLCVECAATTWADPATGEALHIHGWQERTWRHLDFWQYETILVAKVPRVRNPTSGKTMVVAVPWAAPHSRWTLAFERLALEVLLVARSIEDACQLLRLHWDSAHKILERAVHRGLARREEKPMAHVGIDEKSFGRGHSYATVLSDIDGRRCWR
ncbi:MAG: transposase [Verrucomicrobiales bacterium]|nr:transposase [Verrucomicrobiales bacterium]